MKVIYNEDSAMRQLLAPDTAPNEVLRWSWYSVLLDCEEGCLVWNTFTDVLVLLEHISAREARENPNGLTDRDALYGYSFLVPQSLNEYERLAGVRFMQSFAKKPEHGSGYTILTTLACNARCPYCYEKDYPKTAMTDETAQEAARFILDRCKADETVSLSWFGGEPLVNTRPIDRICREIRAAGVDFESRMATNGYLFDAALIDRAVREWKLKRVQITLDGTEEIYNRTKNYVNSKGSPYKRVLNNIEALADAGVDVAIRLNLSLDNADDLLQLADVLGERFGGNEFICAYVTPLFEYYEPSAAPLAKEVFAAYKVLTDRLIRRRVALIAPLPTELRTNHCMSDHDEAFCILPGGQLGKCEHYTEDHAVGDLARGVTNDERIAYFKQRVDGTERCKTCFFAPECTLLKVCAVQCCELYLLWQRAMMEDSMQKALEAYRENEPERT